MSRIPGAPAPCVQQGAQLEMAFDDSLPSLDSYSVKVSRRARNVSFQVLPLTGLEVTIPARFPRREIPGLIHSNRAWIEKQLRQVAQSTDPEFLVWPPEVLRLRGIGVELRVQFCHSGGRDLRGGQGCTDAQGPDCDPDRNPLHGEIRNNVLTVYGCAASGWIHTSAGRATLLQLLGTLLKEQARRHLEPQVQEVANAHGLEFRRLSIRGQRTLWGSYSSSGTLSLNYKLLFLPPEYGRYIICHELAHTRHLDHSPAFWRFLASMEPQARRLDKQLNEVGRLVPPWL